MKDVGRRVRRELIDQWIKKAYPDGLYKLATASKIPANSLTKIRLGWIPKNRHRRLDLANALGTTEKDLFPSVEDRDEAS